MCVQLHSLYFDRSNPRTRRLQYSTLVTRKIGLKYTDMIVYGTTVYTEYHTIAHHAKECNAMQCNAMQCNAMQYE